jgi:hypothetical protein
VPLLANEDAALKQKLGGLIVHDSTAGPQGRAVTVRFKSPEYELADAVFPLILISHAGISKDSTREFRGYGTVGYAPEGYQPWADIADPAQSPYTAEAPIPLNVDYHLEVLARKQAHMVELLAALSQFDYLPPRFGYLSVPQDGTVRRLDILGGPETTESTDQLDKRLFTAAWSIRVSAEIFLSKIDQLTPAQRVVLDVVDGPAFQTGDLVHLDPPISVSKTQLVATTSTLPVGHVGVPYQYALSATGGTPPYSWSLESGSPPQGLVLASSGFVFGIPVTATTPSPASFVLGLTDSDSPPQVVRQTLTLAVSGS